MQKSQVARLELWLRMNRPLVRLSRQDATAAIVRTQHKRITQHFHPKTESKPSEDPPSQRTANPTTTQSEEKNSEKPGPV
jgi:hypothetical protein